MVSPPSSSPSFSGFVELTRSFHDISQEDNDRGDADVGRFFPTAGRLGWQELLQEYRLIILSEAGAGKTEEIRNIARSLRSEGKAAFFIRLEHIASDFEDAFEVGTSDEFDSWLASSEEGWLLLDSIDEARLRSPGDFELAIRKLGRRINKTRDRAHVVITGRTTAWRPRNDLDFCTTHLPCIARLSTAEAGDGDSDSHRTKITADRTGQRPLFRVVALDDLNAGQIATFVKARGISDPQPFLDAIQRADAWSFTTRPEDLAELSDFWLDKGGHIGSRLEIMRNSIDRRLTERDQDRADAHPLSAQRAREGARLLAAAATLMRTQILRVPDGTDNTRGLDVRTVLADWDDGQQAALLTRPIFDEAIYGTVRFHHRSVREYLAAEWFAGLLARQASRRSVERLFFGEQYGIDIVSPALRPILPWLAILDEKICEHTRRIAPEIILEGGDPSQLPLEVRRFILHEICGQMAAGVRDQSVRDYAAVQRFASPDLADDIKLLMRKHTANAELVSFLLRMVWIGQLKDVRQEALDIALGPGADHYLRINAFRAVSASGTTEDRELVRQRFLAEGDVLDRDWLGELIDGLDPSAANLTWLVACLTKSSEKKRHATDHLGGRIGGLIGMAELGVLPGLLGDINGLLDRPPVIERRHCEVSAKFQWLSASAAEVLKRLIEARHPAAADPDALSVLQKLCALRGYGLDEFRQVREKLEELVPAWPELNRALFWFEVATSRDRLGEGGKLTEFWEVAPFGTFAKFGPLDFDYALEQILHRPLADDRLVVLSLAFHLYRLAGRPRGWRERLKKTTAGDALLSMRLAGYLNPPARGSQDRRWKQQEARWRRQSAARKARTAKYHAGWKDYLDKISKKSG